MLYLFYALLLRSAERTCFTFKVNARLESLNGDYVKMSPIFFYNPDGMPIQVHTASVSVFFFGPVFFPPVFQTHTHTKDAQTRTFEEG